RDPADAGDRGGDRAAPRRRRDRLAGVRGRPLRGPRVKVILNGEGAEVRDGATVSDLVSAAGGGEAERRGIAVALEGEVVPRSAWDETLVEEGQHVEVLRAVQGG